MKMGGCGSSCITNSTYGLAFGDLFTFTHWDGGHVSVKSRISITVINDHMIAISYPAAVSFDDLAITCCLYRCTSRSCKINCCMHSVNFMHRMKPDTEPGHCIQICFEEVNSNRLNAGNASYHISSVIRPGKNSIKRILLDLNLKHQLVNLLLGFNEDLCGICKFRKARIFITTTGSTLPH